MPDDAAIQAALVQALEGLGSPDASWRAGMAAGIDQYIRKLGLSWKDIADAIQIMSSVHHWSGGWRDRAPRRDTDWTRFTDTEDRFGYGRWRQGQALTVRLYKPGSSSWFAAINGNVLRRFNGEPRLFKLLDNAKTTVEEHAADGLEYDRRSRNGSIPTGMTPQEPLDELELEARRDHLRLLAHTACVELLELVRLYKKLQDRGDKLGPSDCHKWADVIDDLEAARRRYVRTYRRYDGPQIIFQAAESFAGPKIASVIENSMTAWRERLMAEASAAIERERAKG